MDYIERLQTIETEVRNNWVANDGGLSHAAVDVLRDITWAKRIIDDMPNMFENVLQELRDNLYEDILTASTGAEADVLDIVRRASIRELNSRQ